MPSLTGGDAEITLITSGACTLESASLLRKPCRAATKSAFCDWRIGSTNRADKALPSLITAASPTMCLFKLEFTYTKAANSSPMLIDDQMYVNDFEESFITLLLRPN